MKALFFLVCIIAAVSMSGLTLYLANGISPFPPPPEPEVEEPADASPIVFTDSRKALDELITALQHERESYEEKVIAVAEKEEELAVQEVLLNQLKTQLDELQAKLDDSILRVKNTEQGNLQRLAEIYAKMAPDSAVSVLEEMKAERAARILSLMGDRQAAGILDAAVQGDEEGSTQAADWADNMRRLTNSPE